MTNKLSDMEKYLCGQSSDYGMINYDTCANSKELINHLPSPFYEKFSIINHLQCPNRSMACGLDNCSDLSLPQLKTFDPEITRNHQISEDIPDYIIGRRLNGRDSYNSELNLIDNGLQEIIETYRLEKLHDNPEFQGISILDAGCGRGLAHLEIKKLLGIKQIFGVTLPLHCEKINNEILYADYLNLQTEKDHQMDLGISVHGFTCYNPYKKFADGLHSLACMLRSIKIGGLLIDSEASGLVRSALPYLNTIDQLIDNNIIKPYPLAKQYIKNNLTRENKKLLPPVFEIIGLLTKEKIFTILKNYPA